jgi:hypothetical protein
MKVTGFILLFLAACGVAYYLLVPRNTFIIFHRPDGGTVAFSRWRIEFEGPPDRYAVGAFDHIESYVSRLMAKPRKSQWVSMFTPAGDRGFALHGSDGTIEAHLTVEWRHEPQREAAIVPSSNRVRYRRPRITLPATVACQTPHGYWPIRWPGVLRRSRRLRGGSWKSFAGFPQQSR